MRESITSITFDINLLLGSVYMVLGTRDNPPYRGNFIEHLYEKMLSLLAESNLTLFN